MSHAVAAPPRVAFAGALVFVVSDAITFLALLGAALALRVGGREWSGGGLTSAAQVVILTALLLGASGALYRTGQRRAFLFLTAILSALFVAGEVHEWRSLAQAGHGPTADLRHASLFVVTGLHGLHVTAGAIAALVYGLRGASANVLRTLGLYFAALDLAWFLILGVLYT